MKLTHISNATAIYESQGSRLLADPWLTDGAFEGSWAHFPPLRTKPQDLVSVDYLYISHIHPDHFDPETLQFFPKSIPIILYKNLKGPNFLKTKLMDLGFTSFIELKDGESTTLPPFTITMYGPFSKHPFDVSTLGNFLDSAIVIEAEGKKILNANDNQPTIEAATKLRARHGAFDVAQLKDSLAGPYPSCFAQLNFFQKEQEIVRLLHRQWDLMIHAAEILEAKFLQPFAGQYRLQGKMMAKNATLGIADPFKVLQRIKESSKIKPLLLSELECFDLETMTSTYIEMKTLEFMDWAEQKIIVPYPYESDPYPKLSDFEPLMQIAVARLQGKQKQLNYYPDTFLQIQTTEDSKATFPYSMGINLKMRPEDKGPSKTSRLLRCTLDLRLLYRILQRRAHWNNAEVGCHIEFFRDPNIYDPDLVTLLSFFHA